MPSSKYLYVIYITFIDYLYIPQKYLQRLYWLKIIIIYYDTYIDNKINVCCNKNLIYHGIWVVKLNKINKNFKTPKKGFLNYRLKNR